MMAGGLHAMDAAAVAGIEMPVTSATTHTVQGKRQPLLSVQVLRAIAACFVLFGHALSNAVAFAAGGAVVARAWRFPGGFGVDLFFLISGFIIVTSSRDLFGKPGAAGKFFSRRLIRIAPLYYAATLLYLPLFLLGAHVHAPHKLTAILASFAFIPYPTYGFDGDNVFPVLNLGWTLNYEMFFYVLLSLTLFLRESYAVIALLLALALAVCLNPLVPAPNVVRFWLQPIILEFGLGVAVAYLSFRHTAALSSRVKRMVGAVLIAAGVTVVALDPFRLTHVINSNANDFARFFGWGLPAMFMLVGGLAFDHGGVSVFSRLAKHVGDISFSLYMTHPFCLMTVEKIWSTAHLGSRLSYGWMVAASCLLSLCAAHLSFTCFEAPVTRHLRSLSGLKKPVVPPRA
jgi:exopolysaccharide production protein ExoZ